MNGLFEAIGIEFARLLGHTAGNLLMAVMWVLFIFLLWGLPWSRIISKAGYKGKAGRTMFLMMFVPVLILPLAQVNPSILEFCAAISAVSLYIIIWFLALFPWKQVKPVSDKR